MKINKTVSITIFLVLIMLLTTSCYAKSDSDEKYNKWLNQSKRYILLTHAIVCANPKTLANLYDNIMQRGGGHYSDYDINSNVPNCEAIQFWYFAHVIKVLYNGKMFKINYMRASETNGKTTMIEIKNQYALASQVLDEQHYKARFMN